MKQTKMLRVGVVLVVLLLTASLLVVAKGNNPGFGDTEDNNTETQNPNDPGENEQEEASIENEETSTSDEKEKRKNEADESEEADSDVGEEDQAAKQDISKQELANDLYKTALSLEEFTSVDEEIAVKLYDLKQTDSGAYNSVVSIAIKSVESDEDKKKATSKLVKVESSFVKRFALQVNVQAHKNQVKNYIEDQYITVTDETIAEVFTEEKSFEDVISELLN